MPSSKTGRTVIHLRQYCRRRVWSQRGRPRIVAFGTHSPRVEGPYGRYRVSASGAMTRSPDRVSAGSAMSPPQSLFVGRDGPGKSLIAPEGQCARYVHSVETRSRAKSSAAGATKVPIVKNEITHAGSIAERHLLAEVPAEIKVLLFACPSGSRSPRGLHGTKTCSRTCHFVLWPGFSVIMPVSIFPHSLPNGSAKLN